MNRQDPDGWPLPRPSPSCGALVYATGHGLGTWMRRRPDGNVEVRLSRDHTTVIVDPGEVGWAEEPKTDDELAALRGRLT